MLLPIIGITGIPGSTMLPPAEASTLVLFVIFAVYLTAGMLWMVRRKRNAESIRTMAWDAPSSTTTP